MLWSCMDPKICFSASGDFPLWSNCWQSGWDWQSLPPCFLSLLAGSRPYSQPTPAIFDFLSDHDVTSCQPRSGPLPPPPCRSVPISGSNWTCASSLNETVYRGFTICRSARSWNVNSEGGGPWNGTQTLLSAFGLLLLCLFLFLYSHFFASKMC